MSTATDHDWQADSRICDVLIECRVSAGDTSFRALSTANALFAVEPLFDGRIFTSHGQLVSALRTAGYIP
jgi:hypothetical protein